MIVKMNFNQLRKNLSKNYANFQKVKIAILGDSSTQLLVQAIKGYAYEEKFEFDVYEAGYNQMDSQILVSDSELYSFGPECIIIWYSTEKLLEKFYKLNIDEKKHFAEDYIDEIKKSLDVINNNTNCKVIIFNFVEINDYLFGSLSSKIDYSLIYQIRKLNYLLMNLISEYSNVFISDICYLQNYYGRAYSFDPRLYVDLKMVVSIDFLPNVAKSVVDIIKSFKGSVHKCLVLDLDNTVWGGVIADDGVNNIEIGDLGIGKAFTDLQIWVKNLKERGIILTVCSKNDEKNAKEPFLKHLDMILNLDDFAVFVANWDSKVDNIKYIQSVLNIGFESMVFLDDNPFERNLVREMIPNITVPELPEDPVYYVSYLQNLNLFDTITISKDDSTRTKKYQDEAKRTNYQQMHSDINHYLKNLEMGSLVHSVDYFAVPRIAQLTQRSNQFNLRTIRYTEKEISDMIDSEKYFARYYKLKDKFGDYGIVGLIIMKKLNSEDLFIDTFIMSCRVLKRGMEAFIINNVVDIAKKHGFINIVGEYLPTAKNAMVKNLYKEYGFTWRKDNWVLEVNSYQEINNFIKEL